jgi:hypothetical protein
MTTVGDVPEASERRRLVPVSSLDWKLGARMLLKHPALTIVGGLSLAAAIAIGVVGIEVADELLYKRLPFDEGDRIVRLETHDAAASRVESRVLHDVAIWRRSLKTAVELGAARVSECNVLTGEGRVEALRVAEITASAFPLTRVSPLLGRPLQPTDEMQGAEPVVVLGYDVWQKQFLHDPAIIGRAVAVGRTARSVVGVMPPRFGFPRNQQVWVPLPVQDVAPREGPAVQVFGRLADGARWQDAAAELDVVSARLAADQPATHAQLRTRVRAFAGRTPGDPLRPEDLAVHAIVLLVLGAVGANVATLIFARTAMREPFIIGAQVAFTLLFVPAAAGISSNVLRGRARSAEFPAERYLTLRLNMDDEALAGEQGVPDDGQIAARRALAYEELAGRLREEPGVTDVTFGDRLPTTSPEWMPLEMEHGAAPPARLLGNYEGGFAMAAVGAGYHDAFGARIIAGRALHATDAGAPNGPVVVNEAFMRVVGRNPVGVRIRTLQRNGGEPGPWREIVGVVSDLWTFPADWSGAAYIYRAASAAELDPLVVAVRVAGHAAPLAPRVAALARQIDAGLQLRDIVTLDGIVAHEHMRMMVGSVVFGSVLLVAVVFSAAGLYALMAVAVARRTREIGIRLALGANPRHVLGSVFARAGLQLGGGIITGNSLILLFAWRADGLTADLLVSSVITSIIMAAVGVLACAAPARRALRVQPSEALRQN